MAWQPIETAPVDKEVLICHDNGRAGIFFGSAFLSHDGTWFEGDAMTVIKSTMTHWMEIPRLPFEHLRKQRCAT